MRNEFMKQKIKNSCAMNFLFFLYDALRRVGRRPYDALRRVGRRPYDALRRVGRRPYDASRRSDVRKSTANN